MAQAYPKSQFFGFDYHQPSLDRAATLAKEAGVGDRIIFEQASEAGFTRFRRAAETPFNMIFEARA
jgi:hypothetical protein